jgi:N-acetylmuramoyl-L-alanine amidase
VLGIARMTVVVIDPGHGGTTQAGNSSPFGARGPSGLLEKDVTLRLAETVASHLGGGAVLTRTGDTNLSLAERARVARRYGARVFVSLHASGPGGSYVHPDASARSRALASSVQQSLARYGCPMPAPVAAELAVLSPAHHAPSTAACLVEVDHLAHAEHRLGDPGELDRLGRVIAGAIRSHLARAATYGDGDDLVACTLGTDARGMAAVLQIPPTDTAPSAAEQALIDTAFQQSRQTLRTARSALHQLRTGVATTGAPRNDFEERVMISVGRWLHAPTSPLQADRQELVRVLDLAIGLFDQNLAVPVPAGFFRRRAGATFHAEAFIGRPDLGLAVGDPYVSTDGPKCRRDVLTHELFHMVGVHHGAGIGNLGVARAAVTTSAGALDSADHLAQLVSEIMDGTTDAC